MRKNIQKNIDYHVSMRDHHQEEAAARAAEEPPHDPDTPRSRSRQPQPAQSGDAKMAAMHDDVAKQLAAVLAADLPMSGIDHAMAQPKRPMRGHGQPTPSAGTLH
jgi:hypothetical protein